MLKRWELSRTQLFHPYWFFCGWKATEIMNNESAKVCFGLSLLLKKCKIYIAAILVWELCVQKTLLLI